MQGGAGGFVTARVAAARAELLMAAFVLGLGSAAYIGAFIAFGAIGAGALLLIVTRRVPVALLAVVLVIVGAVIGGARVQAIDLDRLQQLSGQDLTVAAFLTERPR
ncbi:MAG: hypothetical protein JHC87_10405, partial [Thermoleophilaceae bacterium]|nr:hypothetical protein [Thermoleophilaceae bacterium]